MNLHSRLYPLVFLLALLPVQGDPPAWWQEGIPPVIDPAATANNQGPANIGQAKWMARQAMQKLNSLDPALATGILEKLTLPQPQPSDLSQTNPAILDFAIPTDPMPADWNDLQHAPLMIGQLKAISAPFYDQLHAYYPTWLNNELTLNLTHDPADPTNFYPWTSATNDDSNQAIATIGQLKAVFSLRFETLPETDSDGDGVTDAVERALGTNPYITDTDGDGIPDNLDPDPLIGYPQPADADGDGIPDADDPQPNTARGDPPTIRSQTASGSQVVNILAGEKLIFLLTVNNPAGPPVTASNLALFVNGTEDRTAFGQVMENQFSFCWDAKIHANYPNEILQNLAVRFRDAENATAWLDFVHCDVAEWEGMIAAIQTGPEAPDGVAISVRSHYAGANGVPYYLGVRNSVHSSWYRGPKMISILDQNGKKVIIPDDNGIDTETTAQIGEAMRYPFIIYSGTSFANQVIDVSDPVAFPNCGNWYHNLYPKPIHITAPGNVTIPTGEMKFEPLPENTEINNFNMTAFVCSYTDHEVDHLISESMYRVLRDLHYRRMFFSCFSDYVRASVKSDYVELFLDTKIVPYTAGTLDYPGLPIDTGAPDRLPPILLPIASGQWYKVVIKVGPDSGAVSSGIRLKLNSGQSFTGAPQAGLEFQHEAREGLFPIAFGANGFLDFATGSGVHQQLTSTSGLTLFAKPDSTVTLHHRLGVCLLPKKPENEPVAIRTLDLLPVEIVPDYNRDGKIDQTDQGKVTQQNPWRFWNNDDHDIGDTGGSDIPHETQEDFCNTTIQSRRDLIDYFPARLEIRNLLTTFPVYKYTYWLSYDPVHFMQTPDYTGFRSPFLKVAWNPEAAADSDGNSLNSGAWQKDLDKTSMLLGKKLQLVNPYASSGKETSIKIPSDMLQSAQNGNGLIWISSGLASVTLSAPLVLIVKDSNNLVVASCSLPLSISSAEDMLRLKFVMPGAADLTTSDIPGDPPNWPDADRNDKHFVFVHGYNVNVKQSIGWATEVFKRMFWSGSNARFSAFAWYGYQGQTPDLPAVGHITADYQINLGNAFNTAKSFNHFLDLLEGKITVAAHSMGNVLVGAAMTDWNARPTNYFMLDAAAAKECYDENEANDKDQDDRMVHPAWKDYPKPLRASEWHKLISPVAWPETDGRGKLTWKGRLKGVIDNGGKTNVYNFYSSGEEVLNNAETNNPNINSSNPFDNGNLCWLTANKMWAMQEKRKGLGLTGIVHTSNYGGWFANLLPYIPEIHMTYQNEWGNVHRMRTPSELPALSDPQSYSTEETTFLIARAIIPFFDDSTHDPLFTPETGGASAGSAYAQLHLNTIISEMIPCTTFAAGRNALNNEQIMAPDHNIDMETTMKTDPTKWPESDAHDPVENMPKPWLHSDIREKAFAHNWKVYAKFVELVNLEQTN